VQLRVEEPTICASSAVSGLVYGKQAAAEILRPSQRPIWHNCLTCPLGSRFGIFGTPEMRLAGDRDRRHTASRAATIDGLRLCDCVIPVCRRPDGAPIAQPRACGRGNAWWKQFRAMWPKRPIQPCLNNRSIFHNAPIRIRQTQ
jgi:hypothetical protein